MDLIVDPGCLDLGVLRAQLDHAPKQGILAALLLRIVQMNSPQTRLSASIRPSPIVCKKRMTAKPDLLSDSFFLFLCLLQDDKRRLGLSWCRKFFPVPVRKLK